ncbi:MAG TPA: hypothetical protein VFA92_11055 [Candidatus Binatia bacterium]|jgi:hypothetical protein|nr:hypothetical protein [Candidatus Binatia bacterium]
MTTALIVGLAIAAFFVLFGVGIAVLFVAWLRQLWGEFRRTPTVSSLARGARAARPVVAYRDVLRHAPADTATRTLRIQRKALALEGIEAQLDSQDRFRVRETTRRYLPDTMQAFRMATMGEGADRRRDAARMLNEQLGQIESQLDRIATGAGENGLAILETNGRFLDEISSEGAADQPPDQDGNRQLPPERDRPA